MNLEDYETFSVRGGGGEGGGRGGGGGRRAVGEDDGAPVGDVDAAAAGVDTQREPGPGQGRRQQGHRPGTERHAANFHHRHVPWVVKSNPSHATE